MEKPTDTGILKACFACLFCFILGPAVWAQAPEALALTEAYALAEAHYPIAGKQALVAELRQLDEARLQRSRLPSLSLQGEARYQSENISIGSDDPMSPIYVVVPQESFKGYLDLQVPLYDGGLVAAQKEMASRQTDVTEKEIEATLARLHERINELYFSIASRKKQIDVLNNSRVGVTAMLDVMTTAYERGVVLESEILQLQVKDLELAGQIGRLEGDVSGYLQTLSEYVGRTISDSVVLILPSDAIPDAGELKRPELAIYGARSSLLTAQEGLLQAGRMPKLSLFGQGGVGYPNPLNFTDIQTSAFGLAGLRFQWSVTDWGKTAKEREVIGVQRAMIDMDRQAFAFDIRSRQMEFGEKQAALMSLLEQDEAIIALQDQVLAQVEAQLRQGVSRSVDYILAANDATAARLRLEQHRLELTQLQVTYHTLFGNP